MVEAHTWFSSRPTAHREPSQRRCFAPLFYCGYLTTCYLPRHELASDCDPMRHGHPLYFAWYHMGQMIVAIIDEERRPAGTALLGPRM